MSIAAPAAAAPVIDRRRRTIALIVVLLAFFMDLLDTTIVNVAIPSIRADLGASYAAIQWIIAGYSLAFALFLITGGRLGDIFGYKTMFVVGMGGFVVTSALSGAAPTTEVLIAARVAQGFMAAMMVPQILSTIQVMFQTIEERQKVGAFYGALAGIATVAGPIIGALLITGNLWGFGWRTIFLVNLPVGVAAIVLGLVYIPPARSPLPLRLDLVGVAIVVLAMLMLTFPLIQGRDLDWPVWTFLSMAASLPVFALFAWSQVRKQRKDGSPLVVPHLFRHRSFVAGVALNGTFFAIIVGFFLILTLYLQIGLGYSVLKAGLTGIPFSLGVSVAAGLSGQVLVPRFGRNIITAGAVVMIAGLLAFVATIDVFGGAVTPWQMAPSLVVAGLGMGCVVASVYPFILAEVPIADAGSASGVIAATGQIGGSIGIAAVGVLYFGLLAGHADGSAASVREALLADLGAAGLPAFAQPQVVDAFETCFRDRAAAKDPAESPPSCRDAEASQAAFAQIQPALAAAVGEAVAARAREANQRNFTTAMSATLLWEAAGMVLIFLMSFFLPPRPRSEAELAAAGAVG